MTVFVAEDPMKIIETTTRRILFFFSVRQHGFHGTVRLFQLSCAVPISKAFFFRSFFLGQLLHLYN